MKRFLPILIVIVLVVSMIGMTVASAGFSVSGGNDVLKGKSYTFTVKITAKGIDMFGLVKCDGIFSGSDVQFKDEGSGTANESLSASVKITVKVSSNASVGDTGRIYLSNASYSYYKDDGGVDDNSLSGSEKFTVVAAAPAATRDPNATPKPLKGWDIVKAAVGDAEEGAVVEAVMEDDYKIPESLLEMIIENKNILHVNFGTYTCTIDPADLTDIDGIKKLNLKLDFEKAEGLSEIAGNKDVYQLHFGHVGELPGKITYTFKATENQPGDVVYLYYYYGEANVIEGKAKAVVDEEGMLTFEIYHCSSYFVTSEVLEGTMSNFDTETQAKLDELTASFEEKQTELEEANTQIASLEEENTVLGEDLLAAQEEAKEFEDMAEKALAEPETQETGFSLAVLIAAVAAAVMLSILLTMLITRSGLFKRSEKAEAGYRRKAVPEPVFEPAPEPVQEPEPQPAPEQQEYSEPAQEEDLEQTPEEVSEPETEEENKKSEW